jgi:hypothetical protein
MQGLVKPKGSVPVDDLLRHGRRVGIEGSFKPLNGSIEGSQACLVLWELIATSFSLSGL